MTTFTTEDRLHAGEYPLTEEQIIEIYHSEQRFDQHGNFMYQKFARAIERAHGIGE
jgi:hypothetical protein